MSGDIIGELRRYITEAMPGVVEDMNRSAATLRAAFAGAGEGVAELGVDLGERLAIVVASAPKPGGSNP